MVANLIRPNRDPRIFQNPEHGITKNLISRLLGFLKAYRRLLPKALNPISRPKHLTGLVANVADVWIILQIVFKVTNKNCVIFDRWSSLEFASR